MEGGRKREEDRGTPCVSATRLISTGLASWISISRFGGLLVPPFHHIFVDRPGMMSRKIFTKIKNQSFEIT
jgi:hypothetical protein